MSRDTINMFDTLTDPIDAVPHAYRAVHRCRQSVWQTGDQWPCARL